MPFEFFNLLAVDANDFLAKIIVIHILRYISGYDFPPGLILHIILYLHRREQTLHKILSIIRGFRYSVVCQF
jgi:hypothetical protein